MQTHTVIGISPGTRAIGIAILRNGKLEDWRIKSFRQKWNERKLKSILQYIEQLIHGKHVSVIALKVPHPARSSKALNKVIKGITEVSETRKIKLHCYTIDDLKTCLNDENKNNRNTLIEHFKRQYPELQITCNNNDLYHLKVFEAIASACLVL